MSDGDEERPEPTPLTRVELELPHGRYLIAYSAALLRRAVAEPGSAGRGTRLPH